MNNVSDWASDYSYVHVNAEQKRIYENSYLMTHNNNKFLQIHKFMCLSSLLNDFYYIFVLHETHLRQIIATHFWIKYK